jgi:S1-C subfamily serine protease
LRSCHIINSGISLAVGQTVAGPLLMAFVHPAWKLTPGETYPIDVTFDGQAQFQLFGIAAAPTIVNIALPNNSVIDQIRKSQLMAATADEQTFQFYLNSTGQLLPTIANCVAKTKSAGVANAGDFSVSVAKPPASNATGKSAVTASAASPPAKTAKLVDVNGTGFLINTSGYIVTDNHLVSDCVETAIGSSDSIIAIGYPFHGLLTSDFTVTTGIISSLSGIFNEPRFLQISAAVQPGTVEGRCSTRAVTSLGPSPPK